MDQNRQLTEYCFIIYINMQVYLKNLPKIRGKGKKKKKKKVCKYIAAMWKITDILKKISGKSNS